MRVGRSAKALAAVAAAALLAGACRGDDEPAGPARELAMLANAGEAVPHRVVYSYAIGGPLAGVVAATMTRVNRPPDSLRRLEVTTTPEEGDPVTAASFLASRDGQAYACSDYGGMRCAPIADPPGVFGYGQVDEIFWMMRAEDGFAAVEPAEDREVAGETTQCFVASGIPASPSPVTSPQPRYDPTRFGFELCFTSDGILLYALRRALGAVPEGVPRQESVLEAVEITRQVDPSELQLPAPVSGDAEQR